jgi:hypothetical protein
MLADAACRYDVTFSADADMGGNGIESTKERDAVRRVDIGGGVHTC